jgi:hypothetical protein
MLNKECSARKKHKSKQELTAERIWSSEIEMWILLVFSYF